MTDIVLIVIATLILSVGVLQAYFWYRELRSLRYLKNSYDGGASKWQRLCTDFLANISHEIRTPLTGICGYTNILGEWAREDRLSERYTEILQKMSRCQRSLEEYLNSVLLFSKLTSGTLSTSLQPVDLSVFATEIVDTVRSAAESKNLDLRIVIPALGKKIEFDVISVRQILLNLLSNAIKFSKRGKIIFAVHVFSIDQPSVIEFSVVDEGCGIAANHLQRIFEPFVQIDSSHAREAGGVGLGLAVSRGLAEKLGADLSVESRERYGSKFILKVPVRSVSDSVAENASELSGADEGYRPRVLIAEDNPDNLELLEHMLAKMGIAYESVDNGKKAVAAVMEAKAKNSDFQVVLMDVQMPIMNGLQATRLLRQRGFEAPIIAVTAHNLEADREKCLAAGCSDYVAKPFEFSVLMRKISGMDAKKALFPEPFQKPKF